MLGLGGIRRWKKREALFHAGEPMGAFFKIRSGVVAVSRSLDDGRRQIVAVRVPGDCVGYLDVDGRYAFEGEALTDVEACAFDRRRFDAFAAHHPDLAAAVAETLSAALRQSGEHMLVLGQLKSTERVAHFLAEIDTLYQLSLPKTRSGSIGDAVLVMKSAKDGLSNELTETLDRPMVRRILPQGQMGAQFVVMAGVGRKDPSQMGLAEDVDVI